jgi:hypothetical protein
MYKYEVGQVIEELKGSQQGVRFNMADDGATLSLLFKNPTKEEIDDIRKGKLQFGMFTKENVIFLLCKFGSMPWMEAPYHVALSKSLTKLQDLEEGQGYACNIALIDTATGEIKAMRYVGLSTEYSRRLKKNIEDQLKEDFNVEKYKKVMTEIMFNYTTNDMVNYSEINCRIK